MHKLRFLGSAHVDYAVGDARERLSQPRALALLAYLGAAGRNGRTRDKLVGLFWPGLDTRHARHALAVQLHQIRRLLGREAVVTDGDSLRLNPDVVASDVRAFEDALRCGDVRLAADLYGGPFLDGFPDTGSPEFERWVDGERQRLAVRCLEALEALAQRAEVDEGPAAAVVWWQRAAWHDPLNSRVALACARVLAATGDRGNGVQFLRDHALRLRAELEIEPDDEILEAIRTGDFGVVPDHTNGSTGAERLASPPPAAVPTTARRAPGGAQPEPSPDVAAPGTQPARGSRRHRPLAVLAAVAILILVSAIAVRARAGGRYDPGRIAIFPAQVVGLDTAVSGLVTAHLQAALTGWDGLQAASARTTEEQWRAAGGSPTHALADADARAIAARLGAGLIVTSDVALVSGGDVEVQTRLSDAADGTPISTARARGRADSLRESVALALIQLIGRAQRMPEDRITTLGAFDPDAVRSYLQAHRVGEGERDRLLRDAIARDSGFALAALALLENAADRHGALRGDGWMPIARIAWAGRNRLSPADHAYVEALIGWLFVPAYSAAQRVAAWERAVEVAPHRLEHVRGYALACYRWCSELYEDWARRVLEAHDALLELEDADTSVLERSLEVALLAGDRDRMARYAARLPDDALYGRWLAAIGLDRARDVEEISALMDQGVFADMRVGNVAVLTGLGLEDAERIAHRDVNSGKVHQLKAQVQRRERGRHAEYRALRDKMMQLGYTTTRYDVFLSHLVVWEWAYFDEPETDAVLDEHDRTLAGIISRRPTAGRDTLATAHCALAQLRLGRGDTTGVAEAIAYLTQDEDARRLAVSRLCAPFLELLSARGRGREAVTRATRRLNDVLQVRPLDLGTGGGLINVEIMLAGAANLELARTLLELGYPEAGLQAVVRRPYRADLWGLFGFHIDFLLEEARLLAAAGTTQAALAAYDRYFQLRPEPPDLASWRVTWETARVEREALVSGGGG